MSEKERIKDVASIPKVLAIPSFRYLWLGQLCSQLSMNMMIFVLAFRIYERTASNAAVSALYVVYGIPAVVFGVLAGVVVDHLDKRRVLAWCNVSRALLMTVLFIFPENVLVVYVVMFIFSVLTQFYIPAEAPLIPRLVSDTYLLSANSIFSFTYFTSMALGFILAGPVLKYTGGYGSFFIMTGLYLIAVFSVLKIPYQSEDVIGFKRALRHGLSSVISRIITDTRNSLEYVKSSQAIRNALLLLSTMQVIIVLLGSLGPGFADTVLQIDVTDASIVILGPAVVGIILGALWLGNFGSGYKQTMLVNTGLLSGGTILILLGLLVQIERNQHTGNIIPPIILLPVTLLLFFLLGVSNSFVDVPSNATLQKEATGDMRGKLYGMLTAMSGGIGVLPVIVGGMLADVVGVTKVLFVLGIVVFIYGVLNVKNSMS